MVANEVCHMPTTTILAIALFASKTFFFCHTFNEDGEGLVKLFKGEKLHQMLLKFAPLCSPSIHNLITSLKHHLGDSGSIDYILKLKVLSSYDYIKDSCFLG